MSKGWMRILSDEVDDYVVLLASLNDHLTPHFGIRTISKIHSFTYHIPKCTTLHNT